MRCLELTDNLDQPLPEETLVKLLKRNLLPEIQQEVLYVDFCSAAHLRVLCRKRDFFLQNVGAGIWFHRYCFSLKKFPSFLSHAHPISKNLKSTRTMILQQLISNAGIAMGVVIDIMIVWLREN